MALKRNWHLLLLAVVVIVGGWLRFQHLDLMEFKGDEVVLHAAATSQAHGDFQLHGIVSSVGLRNPPMAVWLFSIPALFSADPVVMAGLTALLGTAAIALTYILARQWLSRWASLCAAWLFAVSPWAVIFSRKIWAQDLLPAFTILFFLCLVKWLRKKKLGWAIGAALALAVICQIHYSAFALLPIVLVAALMRRSSVAFKQIAIASAIFIILWTPFLIVVARGEAVRPDGQLETARHVNYFWNLRDGLIWQSWFMWWGGLKIVYFDSPYDTQAGAGEFPIPDYLWLLPTLALTAVVIRQSGKRGELWPVIGWILLPPLLLSLHASVFHYFIICYPALFIALGLLIDLIHTRMKGAWSSAFASIVAVAVIAVGLFEISFLIRSYGLLAERGGAPGDYGVTYSEKARVARLLLQEVPDGRFLIRDVTNSTPSEVAYVYIFKLMGGEEAQFDYRKVPLFILVPADARLPVMPADYRDAGETQVGNILVYKLLPMNRAGNS